MNLGSITQLSTTKNSYASDLPKGTWWHEHQSLHEQTLVVLCVLYHLTLFKRNSRLCCKCSTLWFDIIICSTDRSKTAQWWHRHMTIVHISNAAEAGGSPLTYESKQFNNTDQVYCSQSKTWQDVCVLQTDSLIRGWYTANTRLLRGLYMAIRGAQML